MKNSIRIPYRRDKGNGPRDQHIIRVLGYYFETSIHMYILNIKFLTC